MELIEKHWIKLIIVIIIVATLGGIVVYFGPQIAESKELARARKAELKACLEKVQLREDEILLEINDFLATEAAQNYDNSGLLADVEKLVTADREKCHTEFSL